MMAHTAEHVSDLLNCGICFEPYDENLRIPKLMPCHHSFCALCISRMLRASRNQVICFLIESPENNFNLLDIGNNYDMYIVSFVHDQNFFKIA